MNPKDFNDPIAQFVLGKRVVGIYFFNDRDHTFALLLDDGTALDISVSIVNVPERGAPVIAYGMADAPALFYGESFDEMSADNGMLYRLETAP